MASALSPHHRRDSTGADDLDKLLDYDNAVDNFMRDIPVGGNEPQSNNVAAAAEQARDEDQEVQVKRKRRPVPKLDESRFVCVAMLRHGLATLTTL